MRKSPLVGRDRSCLLGVILLSSLAGWWHPTSATAAVYECKADNGSIVLTDRPKGLRGCVLVQTLAPSPSGHAAQPPESHMQPHMPENQMLPGIPLPIEPVPSRPMSPETVDLGRSTGEPGASPGHEFRPCPSGINPLNPLADSHCSPGASQSPAATHEPQHPSQ